MSQASRTVYPLFFALKTHAIVAVKVKSVTVTLTYLKSDANFFKFNNMVVCKEIFLILVWDIYLLNLQSAQQLFTLYEHAV